MAKWLEETRLSRHPLAEIGLAVVIREMLGNNCVVNMFDLRATYGYEVEALLEGLRREGILEIYREGANVRLNIVAPGDAKRERCKLLGRLRRTYMKIQNSKGQA